MSRAKKIEKILRSAQEWHHRYEADCLGGIRDVEWPLEYARRLHGSNLSQVLGGVGFTVSTLTQLLLNLTDKQSEEEPESDWVEFLARKLDEQFD